jgi:hypothetical protein
VATPQEGLADTFMVPVGVAGIEVTFIAPDTLLVAGTPQDAVATQ